jgi:hypothetical protein
MLIIILICIILFCITLAWRSEKKKGIEFEYISKLPLTRTEFLFYCKLRKALPDYIILAQVQMASFLTPKIRQYQKGHWQQKQQVLMKSVDFLVIDQNKNMTAIELQDWTHKRPDREKSDEFKRHVLKTAGIRLLEYHAEQQIRPEDIQRDLIKP